MNPEQKPQIKGINTDADRVGVVPVELKSLTQAVIGCAYTVSNQLGAGFLEKVYENALAHEVAKGGLGVEQQVEMDVLYDGVVVGHYISDLVVERQIIVEVKAVRQLDEVHAAQCLNYLRATRMSVCLLLNFGTPRIQVRRFVV